MLYKVEGIVFRETKFKESDKIITVFTKENGKIQAMAKGARNPRNKLFSSTQILSYSEFITYKGKSLYSINQGDIINSFYDLREDLTKLAYASYIMELVDIATVIEEPNEKLFYLLSKTLKLLSEGNTDFEILCRGFEIKYISFLGYKPVIKECVKCRNELKHNLKFSINYGGILCDKCNINDNYSIKIDENIRNILNFLLYSPLDNLNELKLNVKLKSMTEDILIKYILGHTEVDKIKSLEFLKSVK